MFTPIPFRCAASRKNGGTVMRRAQYLNICPDGPMSQYSAAQQGKKKAVITVARSLPVAIDHVLSSEYFMAIEQTEWR